MNNRAKGQTQISVSLPVKLVKAVDKFAHKNNRNRSNAIVHLLTAALKED